MAANPMILHAGETLAVISCLLVVLKPQPWITLGSKCGI